MGIKKTIAKTAKKVAKELEPTKSWSVFCESTGHTCSYSARTAEEAVKAFINEYEAQFSEGDVIHVIETEKAEKYKLMTELVATKA